MSAFSLICKVIYFWRLRVNIFVDLLVGFLASMVHCTSGNAFGCMVWCSSAFTSLPCPWLQWFLLRGSVSNQTFGPGVNLLLGFGGTSNLMSHTRSWCCRATSLPGLNFTSVTSLRICDKLVCTSVGNRTGKSQSIIGRAKPNDSRLYNLVSISHVKQHTTGPIKITKSLNMYVSSWLKTDCQTCNVQPKM